MDHTHQHPDERPLEVDKEIRTGVSLASEPSDLF
jgi:hypothetical protein